MSCINIYHPDYIKLLSEIDDSINPFELPTLIRLYQKMNNTDKIPSVSEIYETDNRTKSQERVSQIQDIQGFKDFVQGKQFQKLTAEEKAKTMFGLNTQNQEQLEFHINTLNVVSQFLENAGIETRLIPEFLSQDGSVVEGAIAAANFIEGTVDIIDDLDKGRAEAWNKLPEEASHWWYRLLDKNSELKDALLTSALTDRKEEELRNSLYGETYKDGPKVIGKLALDSNGNITSKPALSAIREEAIGQLIAEAIKRIETKNGNASDYSFFKKFLEWIKSIINIFQDTTQDPFEVAAMKILSSDMSDLMTWEEYRKINNIVNFADILTEQSVAPIDYTLIEDIGIPERGISDDNNTTFYALYENANINAKIVSPQFKTREELDLWVFQTYGNLLEQRQKQRIQEVRDNQIFFDRLLNKTFRKKSKFLPKTLRKYFDIIDAQNLNPLREWNISQELQQITKKLSEQEKKQIIETNGYTNIAPTLKVLPDLLKKYKKNPIVLSEPIKIDGAKKQELSILNGIKGMIKLENPSLKSITAEEFVNEAHNWLQTNYMLGFANEKSYLSYRTDQTFSYLSDRQTNEDVDITNLTEEEIQRLPFEERQRIANIVGLTKQNLDVYHNKVSLRFNDMYHLKSGHFDKSPSAWGNLTYFYTGKNKWKDAVLLHEIQNDNIEFLREFKAEKVDLETSLGRYLQQLNADVLDNITQIESGGKKIIKRDSSEEFRKTHLQLNYQLLQLKDLPLEQGLLQLKQNLNEQIELYKSDNSKNPEKAQEAVDKAYSQRRIFQNFQKRGGIKSLLTKEELQDLENLLKRLNTEEVVGEAQWLHEENQYEPGFPSIRNLKQKKQDFKFKTIELQARITRELQKMYGDNAPLINLTAPAKPLPKSQRNMRTVGFGANQRRIGGASQELNENVNFLIAYSEKQISTQLSKDIEESKKSYIYARNATAANNFNVALSKITPEQYATLIENYKYNEDLLNRLIDEQAQKDVQKESVNISKLTDEEILKDIEGEFEEPNEIDGTAGSGFRYKNMYLSQNANTKEKAIQEIRDRYDSSKQIEKEKQKFETLKQQALDKKAELEKDYGKIEEEVKQTLEIEMNYFTPLVHHLIQKHINQYGKDFPMYFSGYQITRLTQGNDRTAWIYAGKDEVNIVNKKSFDYNNQRFGILKYGEQEYQKSYRKDGKDISQQEYEKAYQQATERRAKEIKVQAAQELGLFPTVSVEKLSDEKLNEGIKALNEFKKIPKSDPRSKYNYKSNADVVIEKLLEINNNKPIETGAIYNAMSQVSGIKLIWQDKIEGLQDNTGGYLVDLSNYNYNVPILYGLQNNKTQERISQIQDIFNENPELVSISTPEQYSQYLDTILPDSKVEEIDNSLYISVLNQLEQENIIEKDCTGGGKLKAEKGLQTNFTKGGKWEIYEIFEGKSHKQGGIDINIKNNQISFTNKNGSIKAKYGLVISKDPIMEDYVEDASIIPQSQYKPTRAKDENIHYYAVQDKVSFYDKEKDLDSFWKKYKNRQDLYGYLTDYGKDSKGEYISLYKKSGNRLTNLFTTPDEYYDRIYKSDLENLKTKRINDTFDKYYKEKDYTSLKMMISPDYNIKELEQPSYEEQRQWLADYIKSPLYKETLLNEYRESSKNIKTIDFDIQDRYRRVKNVPIEEVKIHPKGYGYIRGIAYSSENNLNEINNKTGQPDNIHNQSNPKGWSNYKVGHIQIDPAAKFLDSYIVGHELTHKSTEANKYLTKFARNKLLNSANKDNLGPGYTDKQLDRTYNYSDNPTEVHARLTELKYMMHRYGIYNPMKEKMTKEHLIKALQNPYIRKSLDFEVLLDMLNNKGDVIDLMNTIAKNKHNSNSNTVIG